MFNFIEQANVVDDAAYSGVNELFILGNDHPHWLNLLGQDITLAQVINQVVEINKYFRNHHIPGSLLSEISDSVRWAVTGSKHMYSL
jgi:tRNA A37 methylthiotransferase MiaB